MRCANCPLYRYYSNEDGSFSECVLFGDDWEQPLHYEDKHGDVIGCYIEKAYIDKVAKERDEWYDKIGENLKRKGEEE